MKGRNGSAAFVQFKGEHQEIVFPFALIDEVGKVAVKRHDLIKLLIKW
jgi:hypothetical protein